MANVHYSQSLSSCHLIAENRTYEFFMGVSGLGTAPNVFAVNVPI